MCTPVTVTRIIDGDTLEVEITRRFNVRLVHHTNNQNDKGKQFNCPEKNTPKGQEAKKFVEDLLRGYINKRGELVAPEVTMFVPLNKTEQLVDITSFNRVLSEIWVEGQQLTDILLNGNYGELK